MEEKIVIVLNAMADYLNAAQMKKLQEVLIKELSENELERSQVLMKNTWSYIWQQRRLKDVLCGQFNIMK